MKIYFEKWLSDQSISAQTKLLLDESILCYKSSANRSALLFSFLAFQNILKDRILESDKPSECPTESSWGDIQSRILNDDTWEKQVIDAVKQKDPFQFFLLSEDVKRQYEYWKDRRNDCAHAKGNEIGYQHVEAFWLFIQSNLAKFAINGGKNALVEKIKVHFDRNKTRKNADCTYILKDINVITNTAELHEFLNEIYDYFEGQDNLFKDEDVKKFWLKLIQEFREDMKRVLISFLVGKFNYTFHLLLYKPNAIKFFREEQEFIRLLWKQPPSNYNMLYSLFISMLRNKIIPLEEVEESIETLTSNVSDIYFEDIEYIDVIVLQETEFFECFSKLAFEARRITNFDWARENRNIIKLYITLYSFNSQNVSLLNSTFSQQHTPWKLGDTIKELFNEEPKLREKYIKISQENQEILPIKLGFDEAEGVL